MSDHRNDKLEVQIQGGRLLISIGVETLVWALEHGGPFEEFDEKTGEYVNPKVTDVDLFAKDVLAALEREEEDGTTEVHKLFDEAMQRALDDGTDGIAYPGEVHA